MAELFLSNLCCLECCENIHSCEIQKFCSKCGSDLYVYTCSMCGLGIRHNVKKRPDCFCVHCGQPQDSERPSNSLPRMKLTEALLKLKNQDQGGVVVSNTTVTSKASKRSQSTKKRKLAKEPANELNGSIAEDQSLISTPAKGGVRKLFGCPYCDGTFTRPDSVVDHAEKVHYPGRYRCVYCTSHTAQTWRLLSSHFRTKHSDMPTVSKESITNEITPDPSLVITRDMIKELSGEANGAGGDGVNSSFAKPAKPTTSKKSKKRASAVNKPAGEGDVDGGAKGSDLDNTRPVEEETEAVLVDVWPDLPSKKRRQLLPKTNNLELSAGSSTASSSDGESSEEEDEDANEGESEENEEGDEERDENEEASEDEVPNFCRMCDKEFLTEKRAKRHFEKKHGRS